MEIHIYPTVALFSIASKSLHGLFVVNAGLEVIKKIFFFSLALLRSKEADFVVCIGSVNVTRIRQWTCLFANLSQQSDRAVKWNTAGRVKWRRVGCHLLICCTDFSDVIRDSGSNLWH